VAAHEAGRPRHLDARQRAHHEVQIRSVKLGIGVAELQGVGSPLMLATISTGVLITPGVASKGVPWMKPSTRR
jgi:hypothetical protein